MATTHVSTGFSYHGTTDGSGVDDVTLDLPYTFVTVVARGSNTVNLTAARAKGAGDVFPTMVAGGDGSALIEPGAAYAFRDDTIQSNSGAVPPASRVQVLSSAPAAYSVYGTNG